MEEEDMTTLDLLLECEEYSLVLIRIETRFLSWLVGWQNSNFILRYFDIID
jgi:hypothetical protein